jgi:hypothetical protein
VAHAAVCEFRAVAERGEVLVRVVILHNAAHSVDRLNVS